VAKALTAASIEKFKSNPAHRVEVPDGLLGGLYLVVQPSGAKSWAVRYRHAGRSRKHTLGPYPVLKLSDAREQAREVLQLVQKGADPAREKKIERRRAVEAKDDFDCVARLFIERHQRPNNRSWREAARLVGLVPDADDLQTLLVLKGGLVHKWGERTIGDVRRADVIVAIDDIVDRGAPIVANRTLAVLRKLFNWAMERYRVDANPCSGVKPPSREKSRDRVLTDDELKAVWKAADELAWPFGRIVQLLILTGQRREEVAGTTWGEFNLETRVWKLPRGRVKNDAGHDVPLSVEAIELIQGLPRLSGCDLVFSTTGESAVSGFSKAKDKLDEKADVRNWRIHDLRRTVASGMARLGVNLPVIEKVLNHSSGSFAGIVGVYQRHSFADEKRQALEVWARFVTNLVEARADECRTLVP
jgi:integrase